ncbi:hypothetical protein GGR50DRAFT_2392 [Xylaria sp. CBS 124048]|nr:hypothetical protein GGR50DRAFT_2392 [Xylaria sp. CBS 124048]
MNILCLHGRNQNGTVFRKQLRATMLSILEEFPASSFDFVDGPFKSPELSADGEITYNFFKSPAKADMAIAREWLKQKLDVDGPYDGVIGFSDGGTLVSNFLHHNQWYSQEELEPFKFAIFISACVSRSVLEDHGAHDAIAIVQEMELRARDGLGPSPEQVRERARATFDSDNCYGLNLNKVPLEIKIRIPTVHVFGTSDPCFPASVHLIGLCDTYIRYIHQHPGGHVVPQGRQEADALRPLLVSCLRRASWPGQSQLR